MGIENGEGRSKKRGGKSLKTRNSTGRERMNQFQECGRKGQKATGRFHLVRGKGAQKGEDLINNKKKRGGA